MKKWNIYKPDSAVLQKYRSKFGVPEPILIALESLKIPDEQLDKFLNPDLVNLTPPSNIPRLEKACERLHRALVNGEKIVIYGDYDVDGITSSTVLYHTFKALCGNVANFIPNRLVEGYGFTERAALRCIQEYSPNVIITVDCGINSVETAEFVSDKGIDVIITDHHEPSARHDRAIVVNPKFSDDENIRMMAGVGVAFKLCEGLRDKCLAEGYGPANNFAPTRLLDIVAIGTIADIVPLNGDNRILAHNGLKLMQNTKNAGIKSLLRLLDINGEICSQDIGFKIGPRINAAGRLGDPKDALRLFITDDEIKARDYAGQLDVVNTERREIERAVSEDVISEISSYFNPEENFGLVSVGTDFHAGIVGISASKVVEKFNRPTIIMNVGNSGKASGSCRSIHCFNLLAALESCSDILISFGGHKAACGLKLEVGKLDEFKQRFNTFAKEALKDIDITPIIEVTAEIGPDMVNWEFYNKLQRLAPFGQGNPEPIWVVRNVKPLGCRMLAEKHLKLGMETPNGIVDGIIFNYPGKVPKSNVDIAFTLNTNTYKGNTSLQMMIRDIHVAGK